MEIKTDVVNISLLVRNKSLKYEGPYRAIEQAPYFGSLINRENRKLNRSNFYARITN